MEHADLPDYFYVDHQRLESYIARIETPLLRGGPLTLDGELRIAGLTLRAKQDASKRDIDDRVSSLVEHLKKHALLSVGRIKNSRAHNERSFRLEQCSIMRAAIRKNEHADPPFGGLVMWVSERDSEGEPHLLLLLEDFRGEDTAGHGSGSAYSALLALAKEGYNLKAASEQADVGIFSKIRNERLDLEREAEGDPELEGGVMLHRPSPAVERQRTAMQRRVRKKIRSLNELAEQNERRLREGFTSNPGEFLRMLGAKIDAGKRVEVLYRVRHVMNDETNRESVITIGYPIFVRSGGQHS